MAEYPRDKSKWGDGPWQDEPDEDSWTDKATDLPCQAQRNMLTGAWCGYVGVSDDHPATKMSRDALEGALIVHGGVTYIGHRDNDDRLWIGFDCGHFDDYMPGMPYLGSLASYKPLDYVKSECGKLAHALMSSEFILLWVAGQADDENRMGPAELAG